MPHGGSLSAASHPQRQADPAITALGRRQLARLAAYLPGGWDLRLEEEAHALGLDGRRRRRLMAAPLGIERLYCSLMQRALQSAAPLAEALAVPAAARADIHEIGGIYDGRDGAPARLPGLTRAAVAAEYPDIELPAALGEDGWWRREMESFAAAGGKGGAIRGLALCAGGAATSGADWRRHAWRLAGFAVAGVDRAADPRAAGHPLQPLQHRHDAGGYFVGQEDHPALPEPRAAPAGGAPELLRKALAAVLDFGQRAAGDDQADDLARAFADGHQPLVAVDALDGEFGAVAVAAVDLDGVMADALGRFAGFELGHGCLPGEILPSSARQAAA